MEDLTRTDALDRELSEFSQLEQGSPVKLVPCSAKKPMTKATLSYAYLRDISWNFRHYSNNIYWLHLAALRLTRLLRPAARISNFARKERYRLMRLLKPKLPVRDRAIQYPEPTIHSRFPNKQNLTGQLKGKTPFKTPLPPRSRETSSSKIPRPKTSRNHESKLV